jgi:Bax protein
MKIKHASARGRLLAPQTWRQCGVALCLGLIAVALSTAKPTQRPGLQEAKAQPIQYAALPEFLGRPPFARSGKASAERRLSGSKSVKKASALSALKNLTGPVETISAVSVTSVRKFYHEAVFSLDAVGTGQPVPRVYLARIPSDIKSTIKTLKERKGFFIKTLLPLVLRVNERVLAERTYLKQLNRKASRGVALTAKETGWIGLLAKRYGLKKPDINQLLIRVDAVPPSLALAQSIVESGWATSYAARRGNALFGQMAYGGGGIAGTNIRQGKVVARIAGFPSPHRSVEAYIHNLNTHFAYQKFRELRVKLRSKGKGGSGHLLAATLLRYSELGARYTRHIQGVIQIEKLSRFDQSRLEPLPPAADG